MDCKHERLRCTNNRFFCVICGSEVPSPFDMNKDKGEGQNAPEGAKKPVKRRMKKEDAK